MSREVCSKCTRPPCVCFCDLIPSVKMTPSFQIHCIQHPNEAKRKALSSVPLLNHSLNNFTLEITKETMLPSVDTECHQVLLFPGPNAVDLQDLKCIQKLKVVVVDGTWKEAKKLVQENSVLQALPRVIITCNNSSLYGTLRREPKSGCVSTLEAVAQAITVLDGNDTIQQTLLGMFEKIVARQNEYVQAGKETNLAYYNGVAKPEQERNKVEAIVPEENDNTVQEYILYSVETQLNGKVQWIQHQDAFISTYSQAMRRCVEANVNRKRGERFGVVLKATFLKKSSQL
ncbi:hypothetical protein THRCLA_09327 [Thraustotheca clavata]|uniref:tRNA-uridine aminocarboxypropyltransferase n=1 Tax=Thraustotheca clavata TaxID=74557 RepID=A0A1V9YXE1_9STRA|nr:hypothetical protein THRCLA_09327 [Thraustotheca clavata]